MYDDILVPTDGSPAATGAVEHAIDLAAVTGGRIHALYVVDTATATAVPEAQWVTVEEFLEDAGEEALATVRELAAKSDVGIQTVIRHGGPHEQITAYAGEAAIDLIVMGTHGRSGLDRVLLGSVTEKVIRHADVPVLVKRIEQ